eukprot:TRINITY_DN17295_c0_g1_i1.p2 TRINITY_DN17295_c0_g1~~TRINITY_DN17295_c0_g1_i1.p2  ORF type:complete len:268 (-),score=40.10 TRINITY_DN17295_c0_g1_i1:530-1333(-)
MIDQLFVLRACYFICYFFFFNDTATTEIYTLHIVGSVRCVQETGINAEYMGVFVISHFACSQREEGPGGRGVCRDLRLEGIKIGKSLLVAQFMDETNRNMRPVDVAIEIEQMDFQQGARAADGWPNPKIGHARQWQLAQPADFDGKNAAHRQRIVLDTQVGRGEAELSPELLAMRHLTVDDVGAAQQTGRMLHVADRQRLAHGRTGHPLVINRDATHGLDGEAEALPRFVQQGEVASTPPPKTKIVANDQVPHLTTAHQYLLDELFG